MLSGYSNVPAVMVAGAEVLRAASRGLIMDPDIPYCCVRMRGRVTRMTEQALMPISTRWQRSISARTSTHSCYREVRVTYEITPAAAHGMN
jgi:hypothetical protein